MLIKRLIETRSVDAALSNDIRGALIESLFAPIGSLIVGAVACSIIGATVALRANQPLILANSIAILAIGLLRVTSAIYYKRYKRLDQPVAIPSWERVYEFGAWGFSALLGSLCFLTISLVSDGSLQMAVTTTAAGYAAGIAGRNAGRPFIALGQLTLTALPMAISLLLCSDWVHKTLGIVVIMFIYGMADITLSIRDIIVQALTMTKKEAALGASFAEQANQFDIALNNMSHGLCMLDRFDRLQVWNRRFVELLEIQNAPIRVGMRILELVLYSVRAQKLKVKRAADTFNFDQLMRDLQRSRYEPIEVSMHDDRIIAISRRLMSNGGSVVILDDITERKRAHNRIAYLANYDDLTGLANRAQFYERIGNMLVKGRNKNHNCVSLLLIDLDRFKSVNDTLGHPIGDKLLTQVAHRLKSIGGFDSVITRLGGDEFVVLEADTNRNSANELAQRIIVSLKEPFHIDGHRVDIGASVGIAIAPDDGLDADELLKKADTALYVAKRSGSSEHRFFTAEMEESVVARRSLELDLREALASDGLQLYYQPLIDLSTGRVTTCEALLRWIHPVRGEIPPSIFIPIAEETGLIIGLGEWILRNACVEASFWTDGVKVAVNLSPVQFRDRSLVLHVISALTDSGLSAQRLEVEVTERLLLEDNEDTLELMNQLHDIGICMSLDDFGTGFSSLNYLRKYPFDKIKIDQSFIRDIEEMGDARVIIGAIANLGAGLNKIVVAEGLETEHQARLALALGCREGQGFYVGKPMTKEAINTWLNEKTKKSTLVA